MLDETSTNNIKQWPFLDYKILRYYLVASRQCYVGRWFVLFFSVPHIWMLTYVELRKQEKPLNEYQNSLKCIKIIRQ